MKAVILAAGKGLRMKPLTENTPKVLVEVKGKSFFERQLEELEKAGIQEVIIVAGFLQEKIIEKFGEEFNGVKIQFVEQKEQKGTAHALLCVKDFLKEDFLQVNGDLIFKSTLIETLKEKKDNVLVLRKVKNAENFGLVKTKGEKVIDLIEKPSEEKKGTEKKLVNCGIYRFTPEIFSAIEKISFSKRNELELTDAIKLLAEKDKVFWIPVKGKFFDVGTIKELEKAEKEIKT